jgi:hypothetical protein
MKKLVISTLFVLLTAFGFAQTGISGKVVDSKTQKALQGVVVSIPNTNFLQLTDAAGKFSFTNLSSGSQMLQIKSQGYKDQLFAIDLEKGKIQDLGVVSFEEDITSEQQNSLVTLTETELSDEGNSSESTSSLLQASRDVFLQAAAYNFGQARFSVRGLDNEYANIMINGISMNRMADGRPQYGDWGGLNDATRNQEFTNGSAPSDYAFTGVAGSQEINTRASIYRKGTRLSFLNTNTNYNFRMMGTMASGMNTDGWAYTISAGRRWAHNGYFEGTNYSANSLFASVEKRINDHHSLNFTSIFAQNKRGKNSPNTDEITSIAGERYNSYWGWQEGEKRNSRMKNAEEPMMMLTDYWKISSKTQLNTTVAYQTGKIGNSRLDYLVDNPDPVYYKKLPSYWLNHINATTGQFDGNSPANILAADNERANFLSNKQINWRDIYLNINSGTGNPSGEGKIALYEDRNDENILTFNTILASQISDNVFLNAGVDYQMSTTKNFKNMLDLLGANFYKDINYFGFGAQQQSDLNNPNRIVGVGDKYGYNYNIDASKLEAFTQFKFVYKKVDFYLAQKFSRSVYQRDGLYRNGYHPDNSYGKSEEKAFDNFGFKGGLTYKITGRQFIDFNGIYMTKAPNHKDVFPNARLTNDITENIGNETIKGVDLSYVIKAPTFKARLTGYFSETLNATDINFYYSDGINAFVSEIVTGMNRKNRGGELGLEWQANSTLKFTGVAAYGEYTISNNPMVDVKDDAGLVNFGARQANLKGYKQAGMPQQAYSFGVEYRDPKFWWIGANVNYIAENYIDVSVIKRSSSYYQNLAAGEAGDVVDPILAAKYLEQERFDPLRLLNLVGGKSWRIHGKYTIGLFANVNNVLDVSYKTGGFEQSRNGNYQQDYQDHQSANGYGKFSSKYFYGYGRTYMANIYLTF